MSRAPRSPHLRLAPLLGLCALLASGEVKCWRNNTGVQPDLGGVAPTPTAWPPIDLGTRP